MAQENLDNLQNVDGNNTTPEKEEVSKTSNTDNSSVEEISVEKTEVKEVEATIVEEVLDVEEETATEETTEVVVAETESDDNSVKDEVKENEVKSIPLLDYSKMTTENLYEEASKLVKNEAIQSIKTHIDQIREAFFKLVNVDKKIKEEAFIAEGGNIIDFRYESYIKSQFNVVYNDYRSKRETFIKNIEVLQQKNYNGGLGLIEELKHLINKEEKMSDTYKEFKEIQEKWRNIGKVPKTVSNELWRTYHHHVEMFYDYLRLNNEMRDLDFKHNYEEKLKIVGRAEDLVNEPSIKKAFDELQGLHRIWKEETGPVAKELREEIWEKFSKATKVIHDKRHEHHKELKAEWAIHLEKKEVVCEKIKEIAKEEGNTHSQWQDRVRRVDALKNEFQSLGRVSKGDNDIIWQKFKDATRVLNKRKNDFYKSLKKDQLVNLEKKIKLVEIAESLKESEDWKKTTDTLKKIQNDWKKIGHVPKVQSDEIWNQFRGACNHFFDRLTELRKSEDAKLEGNYDSKKVLLEELDSIEVPADSKEAVSFLMTYVNKWKTLGSVPRDKKSIENHFNNAIDQLFDKLDLEKNEAILIKFKNRIESLVSSGDMNKVFNERDVIRKKMEDIRKEITQLDNNLGFFNVKDDNPLVRDVKNKISGFKDNLDVWKKKLDFLRTI